MFKYKSLLAAMTLVALIMVGCNENTTNVVDTVPNAPTGMMATSLGKDKIAVKWTAPTAGTFTGYKLKLTGIGMDTTFIVDKTTGGYEVSGLTEGTKYTFALTSVNGTAMSATAATITWSPATRFTTLDGTPTGNAIRLYESSSSKGSGLRLYDPTTKLPQVLTVSGGGSAWDIGIDNKGITDSLDTGSPGALNFTINNPRATLIGKIYSNVNSLDDIYETADLTVSSQGLYTLPNSSTGGYAFVLKTAEGNFAKVLFKSIGGKILQGSGTERYVTVEISYQMVAGVPHAGMNNSGGK